MKPIKKMRLLWQTVKHTAGELTHPAALSGRAFLILILVAGAFAVLRDFRSSRQDETVQTPTPEDPAAADTFIPAGFVLVPIEVANYEALDSILGKHGVVDLYIPPVGEKGRPKKVAERIRILRAPLNPSHFAVLAPEEESPRLVSHEGAFFVVVQNRNRRGTSFVKGDTGGRGLKPRSRILIEGNE